jgi:peptide alpha-N-acetyltransferase
MFTKGVPSTFANIKALYTNPFKMKTIEELVEGYLASDDIDALEDSTLKRKGDNESKLVPSARFFLANHYAYHRSRNLDKALQYIELLLESAPKDTDYHMVKARIWKHYGDSRTAAQLMEHARSLDERDRYMNTKAAKYQLRNHENEVALQTMSKFTRNETPGGTLGDLHDMQCLWYLTEDGESYARQGNLGVALKRFHAVADAFEVWHEDQFDFHSFALRKGQVRAYVEMLQWEDRLRSHPFFSRAAVRAVQIYVLLHDRTQRGHGEHGGHGALPNGTAEVNGKTGNDRKKALRQAKKEQQKKEKSDTTQAQSSPPSSNAKAAATSKTSHKVEVDPLGTTLVGTNDPLTDAMRFLQPLLDYTPDLLDTQLNAFEVYYRKSELIHPPPFSAIGFTSGGAVTYETNFGALQRNTS